LNKQNSGGFVLFTGLSGSGKSTVANYVYDFLRRQIGERAVLVDTEKLLEDSRKYGDGIGRGRSEIHDKLIYAFKELISHDCVIVFVSTMCVNKNLRSNICREMSEVTDPIIFYCDSDFKTRYTRDTVGAYRAYNSGMMQDIFGITYPNIHGYLLKDYAATGKDEWISPLYVSYMLDTQNRTANHSCEEATNFILSNWEQKLAFSSTL
jgi:adenylylsulfate kinase-like enzyme